MTGNNEEAFYQYYAGESLNAATLERFAATQAAVVRAARHFGLQQQAWRVADVGCGAATQCALWARAGHRVFGVDINEPLSAHEKAELLRVKLPTYERGLWFYQFIAIPKRS